MPAPLSLSPELTNLVATALAASDSPVAIFRRIADELSYVAGNAAFARMAAYPPEVAPGMNLFRLLGVGADAPDRPRLVQAIAAGQGAHAELPCHGQDGRAFWLGCSLMPAEGTHFVLLGRDITERRLAAQQQQVVQALLAKVFQVIDAAVAIVGADGRVLMANPRLHTLLERPAGTLAGTVAADHIDPESRPAMEAARTRQEQDTEPYQIPVMLPRGKGGVIGVRLCSALIMRPDLPSFSILTLSPDADAARPADARQFMVAGKVRLIGLHDVRATLGPRWPEMAEQAMRVAEQAARKRLGPSDSFFRTDDVGLMICFGGLTEEEASFRAALIGREIAQRLVGLTHDPTVARVTAIAAAVELPDGRLDTATLPRMLEERLGARRAEIEGRARETLRAAMLDMRCEFDVVRQRDAKPVAHYARLPAAAERRIVAAAGTLPTEELGEFDVDALRLQLAMERAAEVSAEGTGLPLLIEVSFSVFEIRGRAKRLLEACARLPPALRDQLTLVVTERPEDVPDARLRDCFQRLRPYCRELGFGTEHLELPPASAGTAPVTMAIAAAAVLSAGHLREEALFQFMPRLRARGARLLVRDVPSADMARDLWEMGVDLIAMRAPEPAQAGP